jgi:hypothetical protein
MTLVILYFLASLDGLLCGCRTAMGRCPLIRQNSYYARALVGGFLAARAASLLSLMALLFVLLLSPHRAQLRTNLEAAASRMLWVFLPYAVAVFSALALRLLPSTDIGSATSVFALGPLTAIRPVLMIVGVIGGVYPANFWEIRFLGVLSMLSVEVVLNLLASRRQALQIDNLA